MSTKHIFWKRFDSTLILYLDFFLKSLRCHLVAMLSVSRPFITKGTTQIVGQFFGQWLCLVKYARGCYGLLVFVSWVPCLCGMLRPSMTLMQRDVPLQQVPSFGFQNSLFCFTYWGCLECNLGVFVGFN